jgi:hypothetical protein
MGRADQSKESKQSAEGQSPEAAGGPEMRLPFLLEAALAVSRFLVVLSGVSTGLAAWAAGCDPLTVAIRAGAALFTAGLLVWLASWFIAQRSLAVLKIQLEKAEAAKDTDSTIEREA